MSLVEKRHLIAIV